jgi:hypothetical protein
LVDNSGGFREIVISRGPEEIVSYRIRDKGRDALTRLNWLALTTRSNPDSHQTSENDFDC